MLEIGESRATLVGVCESSPPFQTLPVLIHQPSLLVCDEPTAALDAATGQKVMQLLQETVVQPQRTVIVVTHDNRILPFAQRIIEMDDGRIVGERTARGTGLAHASEREL